MFFFVAPRILRGPSTDRRETLPHDRQLSEFYNASPKIRRLSPLQKKLGAKNMQKFGGFFLQRTTLIANISGTAQGIQNRKAKFSRTIPPGF